MGARADVHCYTPAELERRVASAAASCGRRSATGSICWRWNEFAVPEVTVPARAALGPWRRAVLRLRSDRAGLAFGALLAAITLAFLAAPLWAGTVAHTAPVANHISDTVDVGERPADVVALYGTPICPTWHGATCSAPTSTDATSPSRSSTPGARRC